MKYAFTISSANYLPYAKSLGDSLLRTNPEYRFIIFLLDKYPDLDRTYFEPLQIIHAEEMDLPELAEMNGKYNIFELSCAFKPFAADWLFKTFTDAEVQFYFDSDILLFDRLSVAENKLQDHSVLITPHLFTAIEFESRIFLEKTCLRAGIYNAGFFGLKKSAGSDLFLKWWKKRMKDLCFNDVNNGLFVDQLWLNFAPVLFRDVTVLYDPGYNLAYWNMEERTLSIRETCFFVNEQFPLVFFHFSGYDIYDNSILSRFYPSFTFGTHPEYRSLFKEYSHSAIKNNNNNYFDMAPQMGKLPGKSEKKKSRRRGLLRLFSK
ncbi:MAG: hypothetical protein WKF88_05850 [Ferruginibacter sp.]